MYFHRITPLLLKLHPCLTNSPSETHVSFPCILLSPIRVTHWYVGVWPTGPGNWSSLWFSVCFHPLMDAK